MLDSVRPDLKPEVTLSAGVSPGASRVEIATQIVAGLALIGALRVGLLASLLAGLLVYELVHALAPGRNSRIVSRHTGKIVVVAFITTVIIVGAGAAILGLFFLLSTGSESLSVLLQKMADVIETARSRLPESALSSLPADPDELKTAISAWLREHAGQLRSIGQDVWQEVIEPVSMPTLASTSACFEMRAEIAPGS